jgi:DNA polymerase III epsilon subunit-like protein
MSGINYYVIDTETTGLKTDYHEMTEIGIIRCTDRMQLWRQIKCEYPERANFDALAITKKSMADLEKGHLKYDVVAECDKFFNEDGLTPAHRCIVAHNAPFDRRFLHALWAQCGKQFPAHLWLCTMALTKEFAKQTGLLVKGQKKEDKPAFHLHASCDLTGVKKISQAHNAKVDSRNTYLLWRNLLEEKKTNHLPIIKTEPHNFSMMPDDGEGLDLSLLDE